MIPELAGRLNGFAVRVPTPTGSLVDLTVETERADERGGGQRRLPRGRPTAARCTGILAYTEDPIVSTDIIGSPLLVDLRRGLTAVIDGTQVKVVAWYDNEWGYSSRLVDLAERVLVPVAAAAGD